MVSLLNCALESWQPGFRDPYFMGWVTVIIYIAASLLAWSASKCPSSVSTTKRFERLFWRLVALLMALLAINKQLDLHTFFIALGRCLSHSQGWYDERRDVQMWIVIFMGMVTGGLGLWILWGLRPVLKHMALPFLGLAAVACFALLRLMLFFHVYHTHILGNNNIVPRIFELAGPLLLSVSAYRYCRSGTSTSRL